MSSFDSFYSFIQNLKVTHRYKEFMKEAPITIAGENKPQELGLEEEFLRASPVGGLIMAL